MMVTTTTSKFEFRGIDVHHTGKFRARIYLKGRWKYLGVYATPAQAAQAYDAAARRIGRTNFNVPNPDEQKILFVPPPPAAGRCRHGHDLSKYGYRSTHRVRLNCRICNAAAQARRKKRLKANKRRGVA